MASEPCGVCGSPVEVINQTWIKTPDHAPRLLWVARYFRDPFHNPGKAFINFCGPECSMRGHLP
jgi:hypothetical protein